MWSADYRCRVCNGLHGLRQCPVFTSKDVEQRWGLVRRYGYCKNCLALSHRFEDCPKKGCWRCGFRHHTTLHEDLEQPPANKQEASVAEQTTGLPTSSGISSAARSIPRILALTAANERDVPATEQAIRPLTPPDIHLSEARSIPRLFAKTAASMAKEATINPDHWLPGRVPRPAPLLAAALQSPASPDPQSNLSSAESLLSLFAPDDSPKCQPEADNQAERKSPEVKESSTTKKRSRSSSSDDSVDVTPTQFSTRQLLVLHATNLLKEAITCLNQAV